PSSLRKEHPNPSTAKTWRRNASLAVLHSWRFVARHRGSVGGKDIKQADMLLRYFANRWTSRRHSLTASGPGQLPVSQLFYSFVSRERYLQIELPVAQGFHFHGIQDPFNFLVVASKNLLIHLLTILVLGRSFDFEQTEALPVKEQPGVAVTTA